jgi:hypothetical protein
MYVIKLLTSLIYAFLHYAGVFVPGWPFQPGLMFVGKARSERRFTLWAPDSLANIRLGWKPSHGQTFYFITKLCKLLM